MAKAFPMKISHSMKRFRLFAFPAALSLACAALAAVATLAPTSELRAAEEEAAVGFRHVVCFQFKEDASEEEVQHIVDEFMKLEDKIDSIVALEWGGAENVEPLNDDFTHCFLVSFADKAGLEEYLPHPDHKAFVKILRPKLEKVFVFDYTPKE